jgi:hypothetical protein
MKINNREVKIMGKPNITRYLIYGLVGGLVSTALMDILSLVMFAIMGESFPSFFALIGRAILTLLGIHVDFPLWQGLVLHYSIGILIGLSLGVASVMINILRFNTRRKSMLISVLTIEVIGIVLFYLMSLILNIPQSKMIVTYISGIFLHGIGGICLGLILYYGWQKKPPPGDPVNISTTQ